MISLKNISLRRGTKLVLDGISTTIHTGEHVGLIGPNGAGKTSLFALLAGRLHEDGGEFFMPPQWRMAEVAQHLPETDATATDLLRRAGVKGSRVVQAGCNIGGEVL